MENRDHGLRLTFPEQADTLFAQAKKDAAARYRKYKAMSER